MSTRDAKSGASEAVRGAQTGAGCISIALPLPPKECHVNRGGTRSLRDVMAAKREARFAGWAAATHLSTTGGYGVLPHWTRCTVTLAFRFPDRRRRDGWNYAAACKHYLDGMVDAGVMEDDSGIVYGEWRATVDRANPGVTITVRPIMEGTDNA